MSAFKDAVQEVEQSTDWPGMGNFYRSAAGYVVPGILPAVGSTLALRYGPAIIPGIARQVLGAEIGVIGNQLSGITEPGLAEPIAQAVFPYASSVLRRSPQFVKHFGSEQSGAETLNRLAPKEIDLLSKEFQPKTSSRELFNQLKNQAVNIPTPATRQSATEGIANIQKSLPGFRESYGTLEKQLSGVESATKTTGSLPIEQYQRLLHDVGTHIEAASKAGGVESYGYKGLYKALLDDLEHAPERTEGPAASVLSDARQAFKREKVLEHISKLSAPFLKRGAEVEQVSTNKLINRLMKDDDMLAKQFRSSFTADEQKIVLDRLRTLNTIPIIPPGTGQHYGSGRFWTQTMPGIAAGGGAGYAAGGNTGAAIGTAIGAALPPALRMRRDFTIAMNTQAGRALINEMYKKANYHLTPSFWSALEAFAAGQAAEPGAELYKITQGK